MQITAHRRNHRSRGFQGGSHGGDADRPTEFVRQSARHFRTGQALESGSTRAACSARGNGVPGCEDNRILVERNYGHKTETAMQDWPACGQRCRLEATARPGPARSCRRQRVCGADPSRPQISPAQRGCAGPHCHRGLSRLRPAALMPRRFARCPPRHSGTRGASARPRHERRSTEPMGVACI